MTDIVERLRREGAMAGHYDAPAIQREAADEIERLRVREAAARREGIEAAAAIAANWNIPSVDKPRHILALLKEPGQ